MDPTIAVAGVAAVGAAVSAAYTARGARSAARFNADAQRSIEGERLRQQQIDQLRSSLEAIITRLTEEVGAARQEVTRLRDQLDREEAVSEQLRGKVRNLEDQVHQLNRTIGDLQHQLDSAMPHRRPAGPGDPPQPTAEREPT